MLEKGPISQDERSVTNMINELQKRKNKKAIMYTQEQQADNYFLKTSGQVTKT